MHATTKQRRWPRYRTLWRWHFYAGLFCIPIVLWLCLTGSIYLFKPQIEAWLERGYDHLPLEGARASASTQVSAALAAVPGGTLNAYELPATPQAAARVLVGKGERLFRVYVHPGTARVLGVVDDDRRPMRLLFYLHGELLAGASGSMLVELTASWAVAMLLTGLALWWPRRWQGAGGVLWPRLDRGGRRFWRDLHAVSGLWVSLLALFLIVSGLPWSKSWGGLLKQARQVAAQHEVKQDWATSRAEELAQRALRNGMSIADGHPGHEGHAMAMPGMAMGMPMKTHVAFDVTALDAIAPRVAALHLPPPVLVSPPSPASPHWQARSDTQDRPRRTTLTLDAQGNVLKEKAFAAQPWLDRAVGYGVAVHEGQLFGWPNQLLGLFTATGLALVCISAVMLWTRRRRPGELGAPPMEVCTPLAFGAFALVLLLGMLLPLFGASLLLVLLVERLLLRRIPAVARFLGLRVAGSAG